MGHIVKRAASPLLPEARVVYEPEYQVLDIYNGQPSNVGEEMARDIHVMYDRDFDDAPASAVTILVTSAEVVLKPFVDAVLEKHGFTPDPNTPQPRHNKGHRETVITQVGKEEWLLAPLSEAVYDTSSQTLLIENGEPCKASKEMAKGIYVLYGRNYDGGDRLASVGLRIHHAETVLKPFVDAVLAKYGAKTDLESPERSVRDQ